MSIEPYFPGAGASAGGGGGGGGSPIVTTQAEVLGEPEEIWSGDIVSANADLFVAVLDGTEPVIIPDDPDVRYVVIKHGSDDTGDPRVGTTHWVPIEDFNFITADETVGSAPDANSQVNTSDFFRGTATGSFTRRDFGWGLTSARALLWVTDSAGESITGGSISIVRAVSVVATAEGDATAAGGGGDAGYIAPKDEYAAADLGKRVWENGVDKVIELVTQEGHSRVVVFQDLANAASALDADGNNVDAGVAGEFLGIFANLSAVPTLSVVDGSWAGFVGSGDFEIQDPTAFYSSEHWNSYNPFRGSGERPWSTITLADGTTTLDHVPFTDPDTDVVSDWRIVNSSDHAERFTTAVGEAFFVQNERLIRMVVEYTPHADDEVRYVAVPYVASNAVRAHPMARWWGGEGASDADDNNQNPQFVSLHNYAATTYGFVADRYYRLRFTGADFDGLPDQTFAGWDQSWVYSTDDVSDVDLITRDSSVEIEENAEFCAYVFQPGRYRIRFRVRSSAAGAVSVGIYLYEVLTGQGAIVNVPPDNQLIYVAAGYNAETNDPLDTAGTDTAISTIDLNDRFEFDEETKLAAIFSGQIASQDPLLDAQQALAYYLEVERLD